jgi:spermidine dehydrogenase
VQIETANIDYLPGLSSDDKKERLSRMSYEAFLRDVVHADPMVLKFYYARTMGEWGVGTDAVNALDCWGFGLPGFQGMKLAKGDPAHGLHAGKGYEDTGGSYRLHFPDGNATIARLLVRNSDSRRGTRHGRRESGHCAGQLCQLDRPGTPQSAAIEQHRHPRPSLGIQGVGETSRSHLCAWWQAFHRSRRRRVLACYNMMIPYLCPELPDSAERGAAQIGQDAAGLYQRGIARLAGLRCPEG